MIVTAMGMFRTWIKTVVRFMLLAQYDLHDDNQQWQNCVEVTIMSCYH
jgi:hypothetical protein